MADPIIESTRTRMQKTVDAYAKEIATIRTGRANSGLLEQVQVEYYGYNTPITQIASVTIVDARQIVVKPYEPELIRSFEKAIREAQIGLMPVIDGDLIRINVPSLTEERRKELVKMLSRQTEEARVALRNIRRDVNDAIRKDKAISEDQRKRWEKQIQETTDEFVRRIEQMAQAKEKDILTL